MAIKVIATNKKAFFDYHVLETIETGIVLRGDEVKSLRAGHCSMVGSFAHVHNGQLMLVNMNIAQYSHACNKTEDATRSRILLVHKKELMRLVGDISRKGITLVPLKLYFNDKNLVKVELGICRHKQAAGKKQALKEADIKRETQKALKDSFRF
ncbi:SsrA-binding protein SmpB [Candidatus Dependentiae bacterium]|nr:SsrA-binding protein SmpB [Candidatus Dependentiae bacterium]